MKRLSAVLSCTLLVTALVAGACSSDDESSKTTTTKKATTTTSTTIGVDTAFSAFCSSADDYVNELDKFTGLWSGNPAGVTVGDVQEGAATLVGAREKVQADAAQLQESVDAANAKIAKEAKEAPTSTTILPDEEAQALVAQVTKAETDFNTAVSGIDASTPVGDAGVVFTSAAFELQVAWSILLTQAGCVEDAGATEQVRQYVAALQTDLTTLGYYTGTVDGIYGPETTAAVKALQTAAGLPLTGLPDPATQKVINEKLAAQSAVNVAALQGLLAGLGLYTGPINGQWSTATENAVKALQAALDVPQTGVMDQATLVAYANRKAGLQKLLAAEQRNATSTTTTPPATTAAPTTAVPTTAAPTTAAPTTAAPTTAPTTTTP